MEKAQKRFPRVLIIVGLCLLVAVMLGVLLFWAFLGCVFNVKHTTVFENKTYTCTNMPFQLSKELSIEQFSFTLKEIDEQTAAAQNYANTLKNYVDGKYFAVELRIKFVGDEQAEVYTINQLKSSPEPLRPNRYFFTMDLSAKGLGTTTWKAEFNKPVTLLCFEHHDANQLWFE